jgi:myo-inositol-1-phosphate synthase
MLLRELVFEAIVIQCPVRYVPYVGDSKRAMDEYTSEIFMGGKVNRRNLSEISPLDMQRSHMPL